MKILVISQRAFGSDKFNLRDLPGHGRFDVVIRCILAAFRRLHGDEVELTSIYCLLKGDEGSIGWLEWNTRLENHDEISLAAEIKEKWDSIYSEGTLEVLLKNINPENIFLLSEFGENILNLYDHITPNSLIILGAQHDLTELDHNVISDYTSISLSDQPMLASHAIIKLRQLLAIQKLN